MRQRKRFGQHFLHDDAVIEKIAKTVHPHPTDTLVEIGPGQGALTAALLKYVPVLSAIEIDRDLIPILTERFGERLRLINQDVLQFDFKTLSLMNIRLVGNLPYQISTPILFHVFQFAPLIKDMHFMLQKEVVTRLCARPNSKDYGRLSVMAQYHYDLMALFEIGPGAFYPPPKVRSQLIRLIPKKMPLSARQFSCFTDIVRHAFSYRRKTLANALKDIVPSGFFVNEQRNAGRRAENLTLDDYIDLAKRLACGP